MLSRSKHDSQFLHFHFLNFKFRNTLLAKLKNPPKRDDINYDTSNYALFRTFVNQGWKHAIFPAFGGIFNVDAGNSNLYKVR